MPEDHNQPCPLCQRPARYFVELRSAGDYRHFFCTFCSEFVITIAAEKLLLANPDMSKECCTQARVAPVKKILEIRAQLLVRGPQPRLRVVSDYAERPEKCSRDAAQPV